MGNRSNVACGSGQEPRVGHIREQWLPNTFGLRHGNGGQNMIEQMPDSSYTLAFVLQGSVEVTFHAMIRVVEAGYFVVFQSRLLQSMVCSEHTLVIIHTPPSSVASKLEMCDQVFRQPCSELLPTLSPLKEWVDKLATQLEQTPIICSEETNTRWPPVCSIAKIRPPWARCILPICQTEGGYSDIFVIC